jgi:hypothetical protein
VLVILSSFPSTYTQSLVICRLFRHALLTSAQKMFCNKKKPRTSCLRSAAPAKTNPHCDASLHWLYLVRAKLLALNTSSRFAASTPYRLHSRSIIVQVGQAGCPEIRRLRFPRYTVLWESAVPPHHDSRSAEAVVPSVYGASLKT